MKNFKKTENSIVNLLQWHQFKQAALEMGSLIE